MGTRRSGDICAHPFPRPSPRESSGMKAKRDVPGVLEMLTFTKVQGSGLPRGAPALLSPRGPPEVLVCSGAPQMPPQLLAHPSGCCRELSLSPSRPPSRSRSSNSWMVASANWPLRLSKVGGGHECPVPLPHSHPQPHPCRRVGTGPGWEDGVTRGRVYFLRSHCPVCPMCCPPRGRDGASCVTMWLCRPQP